MAVTKYVNDLDFEMTLKKKWLFEMFEVTLFCLTLKKDYKEGRKTAWHGSRSSESS